MNVYLDTHFLFAYISESTKDTERIFAKEVQKVISNRNPDIRVTISFLVMGETVNKITSKIPEENRNAVSSNIFSLLDKEKVDMKPPIKEVFSIANEMMSEDKRLDCTDALIISQALCDETATLLLTADDALLTSSVIQNKCSTWRRDEKGYNKLLVRDFF